MTKGARPPETRARQLDAPSAGASDPERVHRARAGAELAQPVADRLGGDALGLARGGLEVVAPREARGERRRVRAARAVGRAVGIARAGELVRARAVEDHVDGLLAMAPGHHDRARPERLHGARERLAFEYVVAREHARLRQ